MAIFPRLLTGAGGQLPVSRRRVIPSVNTVNESGYVYASDAEGAGWVEWDLVFSDISRVEALTLQSFFDDREGDLLPFVFCDPTANLLRWSSDLSQSAWVKAAGTTVSGDGDSFVISGTGEIWQSIAVPGEEDLLFGLEAMADGGSADLQLQRGGLSTTRRLGTKWSEIYLSGADQGADSTFRLQANAPVRVRKVQVRNCPNVPVYIGSDARSGVYTTTFFQGNDLEVNRSGWDRFQVRLRLESRW
jgi:hypothetical protein